MLTKHSKLRQNQVRLLFELSSRVSNLAQYLATVKNTLNTHKHIYTHTCMYVYECVNKCIKKKKKEKKVQEMKSACLHATLYCQGMRGGNRTHSDQDSLIVGTIWPTKNHWDARWSICIFGYLIWSCRQVDRHQLKYSETVWNYRQKS